MIKWKCAMSPLGLKQHNQYDKSNNRGPFTDILINIQKFGFNTMTAEYHESFEWAAKSQQIRQFTRIQHKLLIML